VYSIDFLLRFFPFHVPPLLFHAFSFCFLWFFCFSLHKSMYTTLFQKESDIVPHCFAPRSHSHFVSIQPAHLSAPLQPSPITSLLLRTWLAPFAHPHTHTASAVVLFCFRHGQRSVIASSGCARSLLTVYCFYASPFPFHLTKISFVKPISIQYKYVCMTR
jgi:hypothetical protein